MRETILVGSTSPHKVFGTDLATKTIPFLDAYVTGSSTNSGVSDQPYGIKEILLGAHNRANAVWRLGIVAIGIESGLIEIPNLSFWKRLLARIPCLGDRYRKQIIYCCMTVVVAIDHSGNVHYAISNGMQFPTDAVLTARQQNTTVGKVLAAKYGGDHTDPRRIISSGFVCRQDSITEAVKLVLFRIFK